MMDVQAEDEFTQFVKRYEPKLRVAFLAAYGPDRGREATAEALAFAWEHWDRVRTMDQPVGYLFRVGQSKSRNRMRPRPDRLPPNDPDPSVEPGLSKALGRLSRRQRMSVVLVYGYDWTRREAAEVMGVTDDTVRTHLDRGLAKLRSALGVTANV